MLRARVPILLLGVPLAESENPFLSIPGPRGQAEVEIVECSTPRIDLRVESEKLRSLLQGFVQEFSRQAGENVCVRLQYNIDGDVSASSIYAFLTTLITYRIAKYFGETLDSWEVVEAARYADPFEKPSGWGYVLDSLRYATATGKIVVYRNDEEFATLRDPVPYTLSYRGSVEAGNQKIERDHIGPDPYNALVHLVGVSVLEAAVRIREEGSLKDLAHLGGLLTSIISYAWSLTTPGRGCSYSPGLPGVFDVYCWEG